MNSRRLETHQIYTTEENSRMVLPMKLTPVEAKVGCRLLQCQVLNDENDEIKEVHGMLAANLHYYITNSLPHPANLLNP